MQFDNLFANQKNFFISIFFLENLLSN